MSASGGTRAILAAFFANLGIAIAKFVGFVITGSSSMMAESIHSLADTGNQGLLLLGGRRSRRPADEEHAFGYGRERYFWAFVVAVVLFTLGSVFAIYEGIHKIRHPEPLDSPAVALVILGVAILLEVFSFRTALVEANRLRGSASLGTFIRRAKVPELPVVLLEDLGALAGLVVAFGFLMVGVATGDPVWDGAGSVVIGLILGVIAVVLCIEMKSLLIGESATPEDRRAINAALLAAPELQRIILTRTQHLGPEEILLGAKVVLRGDLDVAGVAAAIDAAEARVRAAVPAVRVIFLEPDLLRSAPPDRT